MRSDPRRVGRAILFETPKQRCGVRHAKRHFAVVDHPAERRAVWHHFRDHQIEPVRVAKRQSVNPLHPLRQTFIKTIQTVIGDQGLDPVLMGRRPWRQHSAHADPHVGNFAGVHFASRPHIIDNRAQHFFPVRPEIQFLFPQRLALSRPVKRQHGVAPLQRGKPGIKHDLFLGPVKAGMDDQQRQFFAALVRQNEVGRQRRLLIRNPDGFNMVAELPHSPQERLAAFATGRQNAGIVGIGPQVEIHRPIIVGSTQKCTAGADGSTVLFSG